mmetsp:Transcript_46145/g.142198  ORF Transcript_46145/g.142198 Transcript_46145/m.142198 type:complete len:268 (-) Transcript_46145:744-1547(-)
MPPTTGRCAAFSAVMILSGSTVEGTREKPNGSVGSVAGAAVAAPAPPEVAMVDSTAPSVVPQLRSDCPAAVLPPAIDMRFARTLARIRSWWSTYAPHVASGESPVSPAGAKTSAGTLSNSNHPTEVAAVPSTRSSLRTVSITTGRSSCIAMSPRIRKRRIAGPTTVVVPSTSAAASSGRCERSAEMCGKYADSAARIASRSDSSVVSTVSPGVLAGTMDKMRVLLFGVTTEAPGMRSTTVLTASRTEVRLATMARVSVWSRREMWSV